MTAQSSGSAGSNVVELPTPLAKSDRELAMRLIELIDARTSMQQQRQQYTEALAQISEQEGAVEEEIAAIKAELGKSVKGKRRSRPTRAASSRGGSSLQEEILQFMKGKDWMAPVELLKGLKVSPDPGERTTVRNALRYLWSKKMVKRKKVGTMPNGHPRFAYRLA